MSLNTVIMHELGIYSTATASMIFALLYLAWEFNYSLNISENEYQSPVQQGSKPNRILILYYLLQLN